MKKTGIAAVLAAACVSGALADPTCPDTDWMVGKVGAFMHYLPATNQMDCFAAFDVRGLKDQLVRMGVDYFIFTIGQNNNVYNSDNGTFRRLAGSETATKFSRRDLPAEIIRELKGTGIRFGLYSPCQPSVRDAVAQRNLGFLPPDTPQSSNWRLSDRAAENWAKVLEEWAVRYGKDVCIWWFDGAGADTGIADRHARLYRDALRKGNPQTVVSFNSGLLDWGTAVERAYIDACESDPTLPLRVPMREYREKREGMAPPKAKGDWGDPMLWTGGHLETMVQKQWLAPADYTAGEIAEPFRFMPDGRWCDGNQYHILSYLGHYWGESHCRYPDEIWIRYLEAYLAKGGCIGLDMAIDIKTGRFVPGHVNQLRRVLRAIRKR